MGNQFFPLNCLTLSWSSRKKSGAEKPKRKPRKKKLGAGSADPAGVAGCQEKIRRLGQQLQRHSSWPSRPSRPSTWRSLMILWTTNRTFLVGQSNSKKLVKTPRSYGLNIKFDGLGSNRWSIYLERKSGLKDPWTVFIDLDQMSNSCSEQSEAFSNWLNKISVKYGGGLVKVIGQFLNLGRLFHALFVKKNPISTENKSQRLVAEYEFNI